jgi:hypothetical protein
MTKIKKKSMEAGSVDTTAIEDGSVGVADLSQAVKDMINPSAQTPLRHSVSPVSTPVPAASSVYGTLFGSQYLPLTVGTWLIVLRVSLGPNGASFVQGDGLVGVSVDAGANSFSDRADGDTSVFISSLSGAVLGGRTMAMLKTVAVNTNYYAKLRISFTGGTPTYGGVFEAIKLG